MGGRHQNKPETKLGRKRLWVAGTKINQPFLF